MPSPYTERQQHYDLAIEAITIAALQGKPLSHLVGEEAAIEAQNLVSSIDHARNRDTPAKTWWDCQPTHPAIARALRIDPDQMGGRYALWPFRLYHDGEKHVILAAYPAPRFLGPIDFDHLEIEAVLAWNPVTNDAEILGDHTPGLFGIDSERTDQFTLYASPRDFLTAWAIERAGFYVRLTDARKNKWADIADRDTCPGQLAVGNIDKIRWHSLPREFEAIGFDTAKLNRAILRNANVPRAYANQKSAAA